ncbi:MAG TPA: DUF4147 domain-containing protein [Pyrinomonadaceae bacterium]|nr:DUF4147 domain-containing protein [Pyrinomonadaceae bacterium]
MRGPDELAELRRAAREIFAEALADADAARAVRQSLRLEGARLSIAGDVFDLGDAPAHVSGDAGARVSGDARGRVYSVAFGKAAHAMASALDSVLGERLAGGVLSAPATQAHATRLARWQTFAGGHPVPNEESLLAARAAFELLARADREGALVVFLVSGGGSAMLEAPADARLTLEDLRDANRALVGCGASIAEINAVRRALSSVKGGRLAARAPHAAQLSLVVSDVNKGEEANVASGPTYPAPDDAREAAEVLARYRLDALLPPRIVRAVEGARARATPDDATGAPRKYQVLLDNERAVERAARLARERGFAVEVARDLVEQDVSEGARALVARLVELRARERDARGVCLVSGGEFACPVRGAGVGGRNSETALRCALEMEGGNLRMVALSAGTDGVDGNSAAAGAFADDMTVRRAHELGLDARRFLDASDAYTFFDALGDALVTGPTGTNVRDLRIMLAS